MKAVSLYSYTLSLAAPVNLALVHVPKCGRITSRISPESVVKCLNSKLD